MDNLWQQSVRGALAHLRTADEAARRRYDDGLYGGSWLDGSVAPYSFDSLMKIIPSKASRRLQYKTQVMTNATEFINGHIRSRKSHTEDVATISSVIARVLGLNNDLCEAVAYGHDIGHTPFGHLGEQFLGTVGGKKFRHEVFGVVIAQKIERQGRGLNLTHQVLEGMLNHSRGPGELTVNSRISQEASVAMYADKIAYTWSDIRDVFNTHRGGLSLDDYPGLKKNIAWFGDRQRLWVQNTIIAICEESATKGTIRFVDSEAAQRFSEIRKGMYEVYGRVNYSASHDDSVLRRVYDLCLKLEAEEGVSAIITFALLCDHEVTDLARRNKPGAKDLKEQVSIAEIIPWLRGKEIDYSDPDLGW